jgi:hypothetical protein
MGVGLAIIVTLLSGMTSHLVRVAGERPELFEQAE